MADTYLIDTEIELVRQEGDTASIEFLNYIEGGLDLTGYTIKFQAFKNGVVAIDKTTEDGTIIVEDILDDGILIGQDIYIPLISTDTIGLSGILPFEIEVSKDVNTVNESIITIGKGSLRIIKQKIAND